MWHIKILNSCTFTDISWKLWCCFNKWSFEHNIFASDNLWCTTLNMMFSVIWNKVTRVIFWMITILRLLISWHEYVQECYEVCLCYTMVYKLTKSVHISHLAIVSSTIFSPCILKCKHKHLPIVCSIISSSCILKHKTIISNIHVYYTKCHNENKLNHFEIFLVLMDSIILTINRHDTLKPLGI
jgi:hypothetical protein